MSCNMEYNIEFPMEHGEEIYCSSITVDKLTVAESDHLKLSSLLPLEVWISVLRKIEKDNLKSLADIANSSCFFRELLIDRRTSFLFGDVFDIMRTRVDWKDIDPVIVTRNSMLPVKQVNPTSTTGTESENPDAINNIKSFYEKALFNESDEEEEEEDIQDINNEVFDNDVPNQNDNNENGGDVVPNSDNEYSCDSCGRKIVTSWFSNILNLRFVSKTWRKGVDVFYSEKTTLINEKYYVFLDENASDATRHFSKTHSKNVTVNPFLCRSAILDICVENSNFISSLRLLEAYGKFFYDVKLEMVDFLWVDMEDVGFPRLQLVLQHLPNLKRLELSLFDVDWNEDTKLDLPCKLESLEYLESNFVTKYVLKYLVPNAPKLKGLVINESEINQEGYHPDGMACTTEFHNLDLTLLKANLSSRMSKCLFDCNRFKFLETLDLHVSSSCYFITCSLLFFRINQNWKGTLTRLILTFDTHRSEFQRTNNLDKYNIIVNQMLYDTMGESLELDKLKTFRMSVSENLVSTNFLYATRKTLEDLTINIRYSPNVKEDSETLKSILSKEKINFENMKNNKHERDGLWKDFGKLKKAEYNLKINTCLLLPEIDRKPFEKHEFQCSLVRQD